MIDLNKEHQPVLASLQSQLDSVVLEVVSMKQDMKSQNKLVTNMITTLKRIIDSGYLERHETTSNGDMI